MVGYIDGCVVDGAESWKDAGINNHCGGGGERTGDGRSEDCIEGGHDTNIACFGSSRPVRAKMFLVRRAYGLIL